MKTAMYLKTILPTCANPGCNNPVAIRKGNIRDGTANFRAQCEPCHRGRNKNPDVESIRKGQCSNQNGRLGFECPTDHSKIKPDMKGSFHIDHIDGNRWNNDPSNHQELCAHCHNEKGKRCGDFSKPRIRQIADERGLKSDLEGMFDYE